MVHAIVGGGSAFEHKGERMLDARTLFHYAATGISPAMAAAQPGSGSAYIYTARDSNGRYFEGGKTPKVTIPAPVPAALFWSFSIYDNQHRSFLETDQKLAGIDCTFPAMKKKRRRVGNGVVQSERARRAEGNWVQTVPGKGWFTMFRLYGPLQPWFDKTWKPGDFELVP